MRFYRPLGALIAIGFIVLLVLADWLVRLLSGQPTF